MHRSNKVKNICIAVTGLPGSGKSTIGRQIAKVLDFDFLDKDDYLEMLFQEQGTGDADWRRRLSRESDRQFQLDAVTSKTVVLASHWRPVGENSRSGTPTEWLSEHFSNLAELYCMCSVEVATERFISRNRHPGHLDSQRSRQEISDWMLDYLTKLPLSLGMLVSVQTDSDLQLSNVVGKLRKQLQIDV